MQNHSTDRGSSKACGRASAYDSDALMADVTYLAAPALDGRLPGSPGDVATRKFLTDRFACLQLAKVPGLATYEQPFTNDDGQPTASVLGWIEGSDAQLKAEVIVVAAHHDHLGSGHLGANDDATGVAALLAIAHELATAATAPKRSVLLAAFGSEETGFEGSAYFVKHPPQGVDPSKIVYAINMDMLGSYTAAGQLDMLGALDGSYGKQVTLAHQSEFQSLTISTGDGSNVSDNVTFCSRGIPYLFPWTEDKACYHKTCDTVDRVDVPHFAQIARLIGALTRDLADTTHNLAGDLQPGKDVCGVTGN